MSKIIGIDLGTTNSCVAIMEGNEPKVIVNAEGSRITPSVVGFAKNGERLVGQVAKRQAVTNPENTVFSIKRFMGRKYEEVNEEMKMVPYKVTRAPNGDARLGGDNIDQRLIDWIIDEFRKDQGIDLSKDKMALQRLKEAAEKGMIELRLTMSTDSNLPFITAAQSGPKHLNLQLTRAKFEQLIGDIVQKTMGPVRAAINDAGIDPKKIDEVVLVGGSTRIPMVQKIVQDFFGKEPHKGVNPDEVVAVGAAVQGGVLGGDVKDVLLLDVAPLSLGIETLGGVMTKLIERNTTIPTHKKETFSTAADNQTSVEIKVLQGEREMARDNKLLGVFHLIGLPPAPRGMPQIEVGFDIDANGIMNVSAKDLGTGKEQKITITSSSGLSKEDVEKLVRDAEAHAAEDQGRREEIEAKNQLDSLVYQVEKMLNENRDKISGADVSNLESAISEARKAMEQGGIDNLKRATENLTKASHKLAEVMYQQAGAQAPPSGGGAKEQPQSKDDVIEAEVVDENK